jgi:5-methylcytosine-specific restriction endonuclease McrA
MIKCEKCGYDKNESLVELHHIVPKFLGGTDKDGRIYLCKECHKKLHDLIAQELKYRTEEWLKNDSQFEKR